VLLFEKAREMGRCGVVMKDEAKLIVCSGKEFE